MGAFREFFDKLVAKFSDPIIDIRNKLIGPTGFLDTVKNKIGGIDDIFDQHVSGPLVEAIGNIGGLPAKLLSNIESLVSFLDGQKDNVVGFFSDTKTDVANKAIAFHIERMQVAKCVSALDDIYNAYPQIIKDYPGITEYYNTRKAELEGEGMNTFSDLGLNLVGKGIVDGVNAVTQNAFNNLMPVFNQLLDPDQEDPSPEEALRSIAGAGEFGLNAVVAFMLGHFLSPVLSTSTAPAWESMGQQAWKALPVQLMDVQRIINLMHRFPTQAMEPAVTTDATAVSLPVYATQEQYDRWVDALGKHGLSDSVIQDFKDEYQFYPSPNDLVTWQAREVFEQDAVDKYKLLDEVENIDRRLFHRAGVSDEQIDNFWKAHWQHPSFTQITEMLHRGLLPAGGLTPTWSDYKSITAWEKEMEKEVYEWFRLVEVPPHWRDKLIAMSYKVPTRVDVRRWWDLKTITEDRLRELYHNMGYHGKDLEDYVLWTKIYVLSRDLRARYTKGHITSAKVEEELIAAGMPIARVTEWVESITKARIEESVKKDKDLTAAKIVKGVKKNTITRNAGEAYLMRLGYDANEARYLIDLELGTETGEPDTYWEFEDVVSTLENGGSNPRNPVLNILRELEKEYLTNPSDKELEQEYRQAMKDYYKK